MKVKTVSLHRGNNPLIGMVMVSAALAAVLVLSGYLPAHAQGLKLDTAIDKQVDEYDAPNPHMDLDCTDCHAKKPGETDTWREVTFINEDKGNVDLCYNCHDESDNVHPIHVDPMKADPVVKVPPGFPLERWGGQKGTVVCSTCHFIHTKTAGMKLLRGFPASSHPDDIKKAQYSDRRDLCKGCHGAALATKSPHKV